MRARLLAVPAILIASSAGAAESIGRVEDAFTHAPLAGAEIVVFHAEKEVARTVSGADGSFTVRAAPGPTARIRMRAHGFAEQRVPFTSDNVTVPAYRGVSVSGVVLAAGNPVAGASVACRTGTLLESLMVKTGRSGEFQLACPAGRVHVIARAPGLGAAISHVEERKEGEAATTTVVLAPPVVLEGRVLDAGKPVPGADVLAYPDHEYLNDMATVGAVTDAQGHFRMEAVSAGTWKLAAFHDYRVGIVAAIPAAAGAPLPPTDIPLEPALPLELRVTLDGEPLSGALVRMGCNVPEHRAKLLTDHHWRLLDERYGPQTTYGRSEATTDASGFARFPARIKGSCWFEVNEKRGRGGVSISSDVSEATLALLASPGLGTIRGLVTIDGAPYVGEFHVDAHGSGGEKTATNYVSSKGSLDGRFEIANVAPGEYSVGVSTQHLTGKRATVQVAEGKIAETSLAVSLRIGGLLTGRVVDALTGAPLARVEVVSQHANGLTGPLGHTDGDGRFTVEHATGKLTLSLLKDEYEAAVRSVEVPAVGAEVDLGTIELSPGARPIAHLLTREAKIPAILDANIARARIERQRSGVESCYQRALVSQLGLEGRLRLDIQVFDNGLSMVVPKTEHSSIRDPSLVVCVSNAFMPLRFERLEGRETVTIELEIAFGDP